MIRPHFWYLWSKNTLHCLPDKAAFLGPQCLELRVYTRWILRPLNYGSVIRYLSLRYFFLYVHTATHCIEMNYLILPKYLMEFEFLVGRINTRNLWILRIYNLQLVLWQRHNTLRRCFTYERRFKMNERAQWVCKQQEMGPQKRRWSVLSACQREGKEAGRDVGDAGKKELNCGETDAW